MRFLNAMSINIFEIVYMLPFVKCPLLLLVMVRKMISILYVFYSVCNMFHLSPDNFDESGLKFANTTIVGTLYNLCSLSYLVEFTPFLRFSIVV